MTDNDITIIYRIIAVDFDGNEKPWAIAFESGIASRIAQMLRVEFCYCENPSVKDFQIVEVEY